jgi:MinD superfamily P-loop ATPase
MRHEDDARAMRIAIGSGKGGTGKTTVAVGLALSLARRNVAVQLLDCDVEEPNAHLFLAPDIDTREAARVKVPEIDRNLCTSCGACAEFCNFNALAALPDKVLIFPELCHSCGGCMRVCPAHAITYTMREVGMLEMGSADGIQFGQGRLNVGEARATPIIAHLKQHANPTRVCIIDAPPGTSCPFVESAKDSDVCLLVAEPTPFGLNDLRLAVEVTETLNLPHAVLINRSDVGDSGVEDYCAQKGVPVLLKIPHDLAIAQAYAVGKPLVEARPEYADLLYDLYEKLEHMAKERTR